MRCALHPNTAGFDTGSVHHTLKPNTSQPSGLARHAEPGDTGH